MTERFIYPELQPNIPSEKDIWQTTEDLNRNRLQRYWQNVRRRTVVTYPSRVYVYLSVGFLEAVRQAAKKRNLSTTAYVRDCLIKDLSAQGLVK